MKAETVAPLVPVFTRHAPPPPPHSEAGTGWAAGWPHRSFLELGALPSAPGAARGHVEAVLREWNLRQHKDDATLVVTELITNSYQAIRKHSWPRMPAIRLWVLGGTSRVMLMVWDPLPSGFGPPQAPTDDIENGRGLFIVDALSDLYSYNPPAPYGGKVAYALLPKAEAPASQLKRE